MSKRVALIEDGKVTNVIKADDDYISTIQGECIVLDDDSVAGVGDTYSGGKFLEPEIIEELKLKSEKDQLDQLWHAIDNDVPLKDSEWFTDIKAVKDAHPKP